MLKGLCPFGLRPSEAIVPTIGPIASQRYLVHKHRKLIVVPSQLLRLRENLLVDKAHTQVVPNGTGCRQCLSQAQGEPAGQAPLVAQSLQGGGRFSRAVLLRERLSRD